MEQILTAKGNDWVYRTILDNWNITDPKKILRFIGTAPKNVLEEYHDTLAPIVDNINKPRPDNIGVSTLPKLKYKIYKYEFISDDEDNGCGFLYSRYITNQGDGKIIFQTDDTIIRVTKWKQEGCWNIFSIPYYTNDLFKCHVDVRFCAKQVVDKGSLLELIPELKFNIYYNMDDPMILAKSTRNI